MTTSEQNAIVMVRRLNDKYYKRGITFEWYKEGSIIFISFSTPTRSYRVGIEQSRFVMSDDMIRKIYTEIEEGLADSGMIQGDAKDFIIARREVRRLEEQLKEYEDSNLELREKIELQDSLIQELKFIIETNNMNTRKRG